MRTKKTVVPIDPITETAIEPLIEEDPVIKIKRTRRSKKTEVSVVATNEVKNPIELIMTETISNTDINFDLESTSILEPKINPPLKKRGRKPKGGKIIQQIISTNNVKNDAPNVILHLKCSMKELYNTPTDMNPTLAPNTVNNYGTDILDNYSFSSKPELMYNILDNCVATSNQTNNLSTNANFSDNYEIDNINSQNKESSIKEVWRKLKQLEHSLHINNVNNSKPACFWDTCEFDNPCVYIPKHMINGSYHVYGCFCSPECATAYLMNEHLDNSTKFERYHLLNNIYGKVYDHKKNIKPAPSPFYMIDKYYGNLTIQEYRSLLSNERLFLIIDKPLTRILPELHEDNDDFILNNKIIPSSTNYHLKARMQKKKQNKNSIISEKFGAIQHEE
jgi:hypothetical protein